MRFLLVLTLLISGPLASQIYVGYNVAFMRRELSYFEIKSHEFGLINNGNTYKLSPVFHGLSLGIPIVTQIDKDDMKGIHMEYFIDYKTSRTNIAEQNDSYLLQDKVRLTTHTISFTKGWENFRLGFGLDVVRARLKTRGAETLEELKEIFIWRHLFNTRNFLGFNFGGTLHGIYRPPKMKFLEFRLHYSYVFPRQFNGSVGNLITSSGYVFDFSNFGLSVYCKLKRKK